MLHSFSATNIDQRRIRVDHWLVHVDMIVLESFFIPIGNILSLFLLDHRILFVCDAAWQYTVVPLNCLLVISHCTGIRAH